MQRALGLAAACLKQHLQRLQFGGKGALKAGSGGVQGHLFQQLPLAGIAGVTLWALGSGFSLRALRAGLSFGAGGSCGTGFSLRSGVTLFAPECTAFHSCFQPVEQGLPGGRAGLGQGAVLRAGVFGHAVAHVRAGQGAGAIGALKGDAPLPGHSRDEGGHLHKAVCHQRGGGSVPIRQVPEGPQGHALPLAVGFHPQGVDAPVSGVAEAEQAIVPLQSSPAARG